jgi:Mrp family chromosome partitioning ATPase
VRTPRELELTVKVPVLASFPDLGRRHEIHAFERRYGSELDAPLARIPLRRRRLASAQEPLSRLADLGQGALLHQLDRILHRVTLDPSKPGARQRVEVLVCATAAGAGASTVALSLARRLAERVRGRVLLVDLNPAAGTEPPAEPVGRTETLAGTTLMAPRLLSSAHPGLDALSPLHRGDASSLFDPTSVDAIRLGALFATYDAVIFDAGMLTTSSTEWIALAPGRPALLVVEADRATVAAVKGAEELLRTSGAPLLGAILNRRRFPLPLWLDRGP